jgi:hypothetical protein
VVHTLLWLVHVNHIVGAGEILHALVDMIADMFLYSGILFFGSVPWFE